MQGGEIIYEYKTTTIKAVGGSIGFSEEKFDAACTEQINKVASELAPDGWELLTMFSVAVTGLYSLVFRRTYKQ
ncbi:MAG: DUF4177 domain-containing protein [Defluviitaleaceae bacterium]|nr:DUF4177 domain-containing protein [Defluviitaleaceae bacterium]